ncbi:MAG: 3-oxoacyl-ACP synthase [Epsilonproteobacteria bacterium]|nr:3-oxoacyl-ACP synthase [Campylobacterota bacterium]
MTKVNILDYEILSAQGNLEQSVDAIHKNNINISSKKFTLGGRDVDMPFFSFKDEVSQNQDDIYRSIRKVFQKVISKVDVSKRKSTAIIVGTSLIDWYLVDAINNSAYEYKRTPYSSKKHSIDSYAKKLSKEFGLNDFTMSINTACTSSANALLEASNLIKNQIFENVIVIGVEIFSPIMSSGFDTMELISKTSIKPFSKDRDGLILGEAIGIILLSNKPSAWSLEGGFSNCNSATITSVSESGDECVEVMQKALLDAVVDADDITALKTHATGSTSNDLAEINAISKVFNSGITFSALKPYIGHTIGASGTLEIALLMGMIDAGFIPKTISCDKPILDKYKPIKEHKECKNGIFMCNYFGFGGNNTSLIIKKDFL